MVPLTGSMEDFNLLAVRPAGRTKKKCPLAQEALNNISVDVVRLLFHLSVYPGGFSAHPNFLQPLVQPVQARW